MSTADPRVDWEAVERSPEFRELIARRKRFVLPATLFFLSWYFGFILLTGYAGNLGLDAPQSVFTLDKTAMTQLRRDGEPLAIALAPGETIDLPDGRGSLTFDGVSRFVNFQVAYDPGRQIALLAAILLLLGLTASLTIPRRRWWVRFGPSDATGRVRVELAGLSLTRRLLPERDLARLESALAPFTGDLLESGVTAQPIPRRYADVTD